MTTFFLTFAMLIGLALLVGAATMLLLWIFLAAYGKVAKSRALTIAFVAIVAALALHPDTAFIGLWIVILFGAHLAYVNTKAAFRRVGATKTRLDAAIEMLALSFLLALPCIAFNISLAFAAVATLIVWTMANAIAKRREWPYLMRMAGR